MNAFVWDIGIVAMPTVDADGFTVTQVSLFGGNGGRGGETHFPYGLYAVPPEPEMLPDKSGPNAEGAAQILYAWEGDRLHTWPLEDPRDVGSLPNLAAGESALYAHFRQFIRLRNDGAIILFVETADGHSTWLEIKPDGLGYHAPWGKITFDFDGFHLMHSPDGKNPGARFDLGGIFSLPAPLSALTSYIRMKAGLVSLSGGVVSSGGAGGDNAVRWTELVEVFAAFITALEASYVPLNVTLGASAAQGILATFATDVLPELLLASKSATAVG